MSKQLLRLTVSLLLTCLAAILLVKFADLSVLKLGWSNFRPIWLFVACIVFTLSLYVRGLRLRRMYAEETSFLWHLRTVSLASVMNFLLPARLGEFSLVALVAKRLGFGIGAVGISIFVIRIQELVCATVIAVFLLVFFGTATLGRLLLQVNLGSGLVFLIVTLALVGLGALAYLFRQHALLEKTRRSFLDEGLWGYSALVSLLMFGLIYFVAKALDVEDALATTPLIFLSALLVSLFPVNGLANVGGYHLAWVLPLLAVGYSSDAAVSFSVLAHVMVSALVVLAAFFVLIIDITGASNSGNSDNNRAVSEAQK